MKKKKFKLLSLNKKSVANLENAIKGGNNHIGDADNGFIEKSARRTNCDQCPPTGSDACPTSNCPSPTEEATCGLFCSLHPTCYI